MSIPGSANPLLLTSAVAGGYFISRSVRLNSADSAYFSRTPASSGNRKTWTWAGWVKLGATGTVRQIFTSRPTSSPYALFYIFSDDKISFADNILNAHTTAAVYRDPSAWYHIQLAVDTTDATAGNRVRLWVNGVLQTWASTTAPTQNADGQINTATAHSIGSQQPFSGSEHFNGYLADIHFIDGQALDPTSFGEFDDNGIWQPIAYSGSYGTNGFHLDFSDNSTAAALGTDSAGSNDWTVNNISVTAGAGNDSVVDVPTSSGTDSGLGGEVRGNYATFNPLDRSSDVTLTNGNLDGSFTGNNDRSVRGTIGYPASGKWYCEYTIGGTGNIAVGIAASNTPLGSTPTSGNNVMYADNAKKRVDGAETNYGATFTAGDVIGVAYDCDSSQVTFYKNNSSQGALSVTTGYTYFPFVKFYNATVTLNAGARPFAYTAPSGFKALCTANLPAPVVTKPSTVFDVKLYSGNGSTQTISGLGFSPDLVWIKARSVAYNHELYDTVRGALQYLSSSTTNAESTLANSLTAFGSDGFSVGSQVGSNGSGTTFAAWTWDAGSSTVTNTVGSISSQVRANASAGFSVVTVSPASSTQVTIGHGLGVAPGLIIMKQRNASGPWHVWHNLFTTSEYLFLDSTAAKGASTNLWGTSLPSSTTFGFNIAAGDWVAYCFAPVAGYSSFGSYTGNGSADGPFVFTGMRPRWILIKGSSFATTGWAIFDAARNTYNVTNNLLLAESPGAESSYPEIDILSNGFKLRGTNPTWNYSGQTHIYAAFAESPFQYARAR